jgi:hypothetical protein
MGAWHTSSIPRKHPAIACTSRSMHTHAHMCAQVALTHACAHRLLPLRVTALPARRPPASLSPSTVPVQSRSCTPPPLSASAALAFARSGPAWSFARLFACCVRRRCDACVRLTLQRAAQLSLRDGLAGGDPACGARDVRTCAPPCNIRRATWSADHAACSRSIVWRACMQAWACTHTTYNTRLGP